MIDSGYERNYFHWIAAMRVYLECYSDSSIVCVIYFHKNVTANRFFWVWSSGECVCTVNLSTDFDDWYAPSPTDFKKANVGDFSICKPSICNGLRQE